MRRLGRLTPGIVAALGTLGAVGVLLATRGGAMFSPGPLSARDRPNVTLGGVRSHADLAGRCSACHAPPWSGDTMAKRCLDCHAYVREQIDQQRSLHGKLSGAMRCQGCHSEHNGAHAALTSLAHFDHDLTEFPLTGKHRTADCRSCHAENVFRGTPRTCVSCHAEPRAHKGRFGTDCAGCHSTTTWEGATFKHTFPLNHGLRRGRTSTCATCHPAAGDYRTWTCYGCHAHQPARIERKHVRKGIHEFQNCVRCHPTGREHEHRRRRR
jgi:hypothetical protein